MIFKFNTSTEKNDTISQKIGKSVSKKLFNKFIESNGFSAYHICNCNLKSKHVKNKDICLNTYLGVIWLDCVDNYEHTFNCPEVGDKMVIVKGCPDILNLKEFDVHCYTVVSKRTRSSSEIELKKIETKKAIFNKEKNKYEFLSNIIKNRGFLSFFRK